MHEGFGASYHSIHGARQETEHVFIDAGFQQRHQQLAAGQPMAIFELGFGTGLNCLCTLLRARSLGRSIAYTGVDAFPPSGKTLAELHFDALLADPNLPAEEIRALLESPWDEERNWGKDSLLKASMRLEDMILPTGIYDLIYHDAFAPGIQIELWSPETLGRMYESLKPGGVWVSYCAKGQLRRDLQAQGFKVERLPGPPGKREMLRATKP